jgi:hypothetical protein
MKKNYLYAVDEKNRLTEIYEENEQTLLKYYYYLKGEFEENDVNNIIFNEHGVIDGKIIYIGIDQERKKREELTAKKDRIIELKTFLLETDWKVIVNSELIQQGLAPKYENLHAERQAWRNEINQLEFEISMLGN